MRIRKIKKKNFDKYLDLRRKSIEEYNLITGNNLDTSDKRIKNEFKGLFSNRRIAFVAREKDNFVGFIIGTLVKNSFQCFSYIDDIFVEKESRKKEVGKKPMNEFYRWSKKKKASRIKLSVNKNNERALNFYRRRGFEINSYEMEKSI